MRNGGDKFTSPLRFIQRIVDTVQLIVLGSHDGRWSESMNGRPHQAVQLEC